MRQEPLQQAFLLIKPFGRAKCVTRKLHHALLICLSSDCFWTSHDEIVLFLVFGFFGLDFSETAGVELCSVVLGVC